MRTDLSRRCKHDMGWLSVEDQCVFVNDKNGSVRLGFRRARTVVMKCNNTNCTAKRLAYFDERGAFRGMGNVTRKPIARMP